MLAAPGAPVPLGTAEPTAGATPTRVWVHQDWPLTFSLSTNSRNNLGVGMALGRSVRRQAK